MFPDITREDVFRLETKRMWLVWPPAAGQGREAMPEAATGDPHEVGSAGLAAAYANMRGQTAAGAGLHLVLTGRGSDRRPFGHIGLIPIGDRIEACGLVLRVSIDEERRGVGLMTEAVQAVVDTAFMLTDAPIVAASARVLDPAFRRVLEKCGFAYCGTGLDASPSGEGLVASDRFRLDRKAWTSLKAWRVPDVVRDRARNRPVGQCPPCGGASLAG